MVSVQFSRLGSGGEVGPKQIRVICINSVRRLFVAKRMTAMGCVRLHRGMVACHVTEPIKATTT